MVSLCVNPDLLVLTLDIKSDRQSETGVQLESLTVVRKCSCYEIIVAQTTGQLFSLELSALCTGTTNADGGKLNIFYDATMGGICSILYLNHDYSFKQQIR